MLAAPGSAAATEIQDANQYVNLYYSWKSAYFSQSLTYFYGTLSGTGTVESRYTTQFDGDASGFTGTFDVGSGATLSVTSSASLSDSAKFTANGTLQIEGPRTLSNTISDSSYYYSSGKVQIVSETTTYSGDASGFLGDFQVDSGATLSLTGSASVSSSSDFLVDGTLRLTGTQSLSNTLSGAGTVNVYSGTTTYSGDASAFTGTFDVDNGETLELAESASVSSSSGFLVDGTLRLDGSRSLSNTLSGAGTVNVYSGTTTYSGDASAFTGTFDVDSVETLELAESASVSSSSDFLVDGTLRLDGSRSLSNTLSGAGTVNVYSGTTTYSGDASGFRGDFQVDSDATLSLTGEASVSSSSDFLVNGTLRLDESRSFSNTLSGAGTVDVYSGWTTYSGDASAFTGTFDVDSGATLRLEGTQSLSCVLSGAGTVDVYSGTTTYSGDASAFTGTLDVDNGATLRLKGTQSLSCVLSGAGTVNVYSWTTTYSGNASSFTGAFDVDSGATLELTGSANISSSSDFLVDGTLRLTGTRSLSNTLSGAGTVNVYSGTTTYSGDASAFTGTFDIDGGETLELAESASVSSSSDFLVDGTLRLTGTRTLSNTISDSSYYYSGKVQIVSGTTTYSGDASGFLGDFQVDSDATLSLMGSASVSSSSDFLVNGTLRLTGTQSLSNTLSGAGTVRVVSAGTYTSSNVSYNGSASSFSGSVVVESGNTLRILGDAYFGNSSSQIIVESEATLDVSGYSKSDSSGTVTMVNPVIYSSIVSSGTLRVSSSGYSGSAPVFYGDISAEKVEIASSAEMRLRGWQQTVSGEFHGSYGASITVEGSAPVDFSGDLNNFSGTITVDSGSSLNLNSGESARGSSARFVVDGTMMVSGTKNASTLVDAEVFANTLSGDGTLQLTSGILRFNQGIGVKTVQVDSGAAIVLSGTTGLTHESERTDDDGAPSTYYNDALLRLNGVAYLTGGVGLQNAVSGSGTIVVPEGGSAALDGDASSFFGLYSVEKGGTLSIGSDADISGSTRWFVAEDATLQISAPTDSVRTFSGNVSGNGTFRIASGVVSLGSSLGMKNLAVSSTGTLRGNAVLTNQRAELALDGTLRLDIDAGESVSFSEGNGTIRLGGDARLVLTGIRTQEGDVAYEISSDYVVPEEEINAWELPKAVTDGTAFRIFSGGQIVVDSASETEDGQSGSGDLSDLILDSPELNSQSLQRTTPSTVDVAVEKFLSTDKSISYALNHGYSVVYDTSDGLTVTPVYHEKTAVRELLSVHDGLRDDFLSVFFGDELEVSHGYISALTNPLAAAALSNPGAATAMLNNLSPLSYAAMFVMPTDSFYAARRSVSERVKRFGSDPYSEENKMDFFMQIQAATVDNDSGNDTPVFDYDTEGAFAGAQYRVSQTTLLGLAFGGDYGKAKIHDGGGKIEMEDFRAVAYVGKTSSSGAFLSFGGQVGYDSFEVKRNTVYGNPNADTTGWTAGVFADAGIAIVLNSDNSFVFTPTVGLAYSHSRIGSFSESDGFYDVDSIIGNSLRAQIGFDLSGSVFVAGTFLRFGLDVMVAHDFMGDEIDIDAGVPASADHIRVTAAALPENVFSVSPRISAEIAEGVDIYGAYTFDAGTDSSIAHRLNLGLRLRF